MKKIITIFLHVGYWLFYILLVTVLYVLPLGNEPFPATVGVGLRITLAGSVIPAGISFYLFYFRLAPRLLHNRQIRHFLARGVYVSMLIGLCFSVTGMVMLFYWPLSYPLNQYTMLQAPIAWRQLWLFIGFSLVAALNGVVGTVLWYLVIRMKESLEKEALQVKLDLLKTQLHPHFLFNTLNNIDMLIQEDPQAASKFLNHLSGMLRFMLYQSSQERVPLVEELQYVRQYLELQKIRTDNRQFVEFSITGADAGLSIAPLLFLPFLENAFKYATNKKIPKAISIQFDIKGEEIIFSCRNIYNSSSLTEDVQGGLGLRLVRKRLDLLYPKQHELIIEHTATTFNVRLWINLSS